MFQVTFYSRDFLQMATLFTVRVVNFYMGSTEQTVHKPKLFSIDCEPTYMLSSYCHVEVFLERPSAEYSRLWKAHLKNDLRSDQDHRQKINLRSRSRFFKNDLRSRS
jgi:hypothetical protein